MSAQSPWRDKSTLEWLYWERNMTQAEIGDLLGTSSVTVSNWMSEHEIGTRHEYIVGRSDDNLSPWQDKETLEWMYHERGYDQSEMAHRLGCDDGTVSRWMNKLDVETGYSTKDAPKVPITMTKRGHMVWNADEDTGRHRVQISRLVMVAEHGFDALDGKVVHHRNEVPWDNRSDNLELMGHREHSLYHNSPSA